jgi:hypothetical protein
MYTADALRVGAYWQVALETKLGRVALVERDLNLPPSL